MNYFTKNRIHNSTNPYQGDYKKVLCICSASLLRSPTCAVVLSQEPYNYNTRCAGYSQEYALTPIDPVLLNWAEEIICMEQKHLDVVSQMLKDNNITNKIVITLDIEDKYEYRNPELISLIKEKYDAFLLEFP